MNYYVRNGIDIIEVPAKTFRIKMVNARKQSAAKKNYVNAGFFATFSEGGEAFTLPVGHVVCDYAATGKYIKHYCTERGKFNGTKFTFDSANWKYTNPFYKKSLSTLIVSSQNIAKIQDIVSITTQDAKYAITGVPIMRQGKDVKFATYVRSQGWDGSTLYGTKHIFLGLKNAASNVIYIMGMKTTSGNMITSAEAYTKFKALGFYDVIKLDGGGSFMMNIDGTKKYTTENRRINTIIEFGDEVTNSTPTNSNTNPYPVPTRVLRKWTKGDDVRWVQYQLIKDGFTTIPNYGKVTIDGSFGNITFQAVCKFQLKHKLTVDGSVGPQTLKALLQI